MAFDTRYLSCRHHSLFFGGIRILNASMMRKLVFSCRPLLIRTPPTNFLSTAPGRYHHRLRVSHSICWSTDNVLRHFGYSFGSIRHWQPLLSKYGIAQNTSLQVNGFAAFLSLIQVLANIRLNASVLMSLGYSWDINCSPLLLFSESRPFLKDCEQVLSDSIS
jgi:hypothetical protein